MTALKLIGDLFRFRHDLFIRLALLCGDKFKNRVKKVYLMIEAMPSFMRDRLGDHDMTRQILELHGFGLSLLTIDCVKIPSELGGLRVNWINDKHLSETYIRGWEESLHCIVTGVKCAILTFASCSEGELNIYTEIHCFLSFHYGTFDFVWTLVTTHNLLKGCMSPYGER